VTSSGAGGSGTGVSIGSVDIVLVAL
jgi:hypothetical protein